MLGSNLLLHLQLHEIFAAVGVSDDRRTYRAFGTMNS